MKKDARTRSEDPTQEALRQHKAEWNAKCSEFIARVNSFKPHLIAFKRGLNGRGDAKAGLPISNIKDPLPSEVPSYLSAVNGEFAELTNTFSSLVGEAAGIVNEQAEYAQHRRRSGKAAEIDLNDALIVEGSNALTRLWSHLSALFSSDITKQQRLSMLNMSHSFFHNLLDFEDKVLEKGLSNIPQVLNTYFLLTNNVKALNSSLTKFHNLQEKKEQAIAKTQEKIEDIAPPTKEEAKETPPLAVVPNEPTPEPEGELSLDEMKNRVLSMGNTDFKSENIVVFKLLYSRIKQETRDFRLKKMNSDAIDTYNSLVGEFRKFVGKSIKKRLPTTTTVPELLNLLSKKASPELTDLEKYANNYLTRLLKKYRQQFGFKDPASAARLEIYEQVRHAKKAIDIVMDLLESKTVSYNELAPKIKEVEQAVQHMNSPIDFLNILHKDRYFDKDSFKYKSPQLDPIRRFFTRQVRRDIDKSGR